MVQQIKSNGGHAIGYALDARKEDQVCQTDEVLEGGLKGTLFRVYQLFCSLEEVPA